MSQTGGVILQHILGLLSTAVPWEVMGTGLGSRAALLKFALGKALPNFWRVGPKPRLWLAAGVVGFLATLYLQAHHSRQRMTLVNLFPLMVKSKTNCYCSRQRCSTPRLTRNQRGQFG